MWTGNILQFTLHNPSGLNPYSPRYFLSLSSLLSTYSELTKIIFLQDVIHATEFP